MSSKQGKNRGKRPPIEHEFKPGQSGNPKGRPKGSKDGVRAVLRRRLKAAPEGVTEDVLKAFNIDVAGKNNADVLVDVLLHKVARGDIQALKLVFDQTAEPLKQTVEQIGDMVFTVTMPEPPEPPNDDDSDRPEQPAGDHE